MKCSVRMIAIAVCAIAASQAYAQFPGGAPQQGNQQQSQTEKWQKILKETELEQKPFTKGEDKLNICQHLYNKDQAGKPAILVFLHGIGERGDNNLAQNELGVSDIVKNIRDQKQKVVLITCQCPSSELWAPLHRGGAGAALQPLPSKSTGLIPDMIEAKIKEFDADPDRVYITGLSMGGYGTWDTISRRPDLFAAAIPICGGADPAQAPVLKDMAISIFHGDRDNLVPTNLSREMYKALQDAGNKNVKMTIYEGVEHNSWEKAYADPETFKWLFAQKRTEAGKKAKGKVFTEEEIAAARQGGGGFGGMFGGMGGGMPNFGGMGGFPMMGGFGGGMGGFPGMGGAPGGQQQEAKPDKGSQLPKGYNADGPTYVKIDLCKADKKCPICSLWDEAKKEWKDIEPPKKNGGGGMGMFGMMGGFGGGGGGVMTNGGQPIGVKQMADIKFAADGSSSQYMDGYLPEIKAGEKAPAILYIHGGAWMGGSARGCNAGFFDRLVKAGYAVFSLNYRLSSEAAFPRPMNDAKAAVRWIRAHAKELNLDADHIGTIGDSSGGHMAGFLGTTSNLKGLMMGDIGDNAEYSSSVQAVVDLFGPMNVLTMDKQASEGAGSMMGRHDADGGPYSNYVGVGIASIRNTDPAPAQRADPGMYAHTLDPKTAPAFLIQHGTADNVVPIGSSKEFRDTVAKYVGDEKAIFESFEGAAHEDGRFFDEKNSKRVIEFLDKYLKPAKK